MNRQFLTGWVAVRPDEAADPVFTGTAGQRLQPKDQGIQLRLCGQEIQNGRCAKDGKWRLAIDE